MNLKKQLFATFLFVSIIPLLIGGFYIFATNIKLAFNLYEQNLLNSTEIQADLVEENINRLMVRSKRFVASRAVQDSCQSSMDSSAETRRELSNDILNFTDETLDNVVLFMLTNNEGEILYSSGSNSDTDTLQAEMLNLDRAGEQYLKEIPFAMQQNLVIYTPVKDGVITVGGLLVVCNTDYLLRIISSHRQLEDSNAFIYCGEHKATVVSKLESAGNLPCLDDELEKTDKGAFICEIGSKQMLVYSRTLSKTPWVLVSTIPVKQILSQVWGYIMANVFVIILVLLLVMFLSKKQSHKILLPLEQLLSGVEQFFISDAKRFPALDINPATEIGYLAGKFAKMSNETAMVQEKLRESTYLYHTLLHASYEFRVIIDLKANTLHCSYGPFMQQLQNLEETSVSGQILAFLSEKNTAGQDRAAVLEDIAYGKLTVPMLEEVCCNMGKHREECWYRLIAVPITEENGSICRVVLHFEDITKQKQEEFRLIRSSETDPLCGLYNKSAFPLHCRMSEPEKTDALFFIDLDQFKQINDTLGHSAGDEVLIAAAKAIRSQFREKDTIGRFGGDEFAVFIPDVSKEQAEKKALDLVSALTCHRPTPQGDVLKVTASIGVCITRFPVQLDQAIQLADEAMYRAKESGRSQYRMIQALQNPNERI